MPLNLDPDADPDPSIFIIDLQDANKKRIKKKKFFSIVLLGLKVLLHHFSKIKSQKDVTKLFFLLFLLHDRRIRIHTCD
jgi:hypothetical protein